MLGNKLVISRETAEKILSFRNERNWSQFHNPKDLAISVSLEAAELLECFQWSADFNLERVCEELADVMIYCLIMADRLNIDSEKIILDKIEQNRKKYPLDKAKGNAKKYTEL